MLEKRILIAGGRGFIGRALAQRLLKRGAHVVSLSRGGVASDVGPGHAKEIVADMRDPHALLNALKGRQFEYVVNASGYIDHAGYFDGGREVVNIHYVGTLNLLEQVNWPGLERFVQIGSSDEYGAGPAPQSEKHRESPISPYSAAKAGTTHLIQSLSRTEGFPGVVVRLFLVYGPGQNQQRFLPQIIKGCLEGTAFPTSAGEQLRDFCYIDDVVDGIIHASVKPRAVGEVINIASGTPIAVRAVIEKVVQLIGSGKPDFGVHPYRPGENMKLYADISAARELLSWQPETSLEDGLKKTISWYRQKLKNGTS